MTGSRREADGVSDDELFRSATAGARRLDGKARVEPAKKRKAALPNEDTLVREELLALVRGERPLAVVEDEDSHTGKAKDVSFALVERLKRGGFAYRRHLDLHGLTREAAHAALIDFLTSARRDGERCVLVVTGRGRRSPAGLSVLRETLPRWLARAPLAAHVLAFATARQVDGGAGATYVLLRRPGVRPFGSGQ